jgi:bacteriocin biosynthesis cyclodehydratase domain-containing protein
VDLRLRTGLALIEMDGAVQLRAGDEEIHVVESDSPELVLRLLQMLAEGADVERLYEQAGQADRELVTALLEQLAAERLLVDREYEGGDEIVRYLAHFAAFAPHIELRRPRGSVCVVGGSPSAGLLARALDEHGVAATCVAGPVDWVEACAEPPTALACICERPDAAYAERVNAAACQRRLPCLFVDLSHGRHATIGPFFVPAEGACYRCYRDRWRQNAAAAAEHAAAERVMIESQKPLPSYGLLPAFRYQVVGLACGEMFALLSRHRALCTLNRVATVDLERMRIWTEPCWRIPWCCTCGTKP